MEVKDRAWLRAAGPALLLAAATLIVYLPALDNAFIWDDPEHVLENETLRTLEGLKRIWLEPGATPQYYPLVFTLFWAEYQLFGLDLFVYHLVNVVLHAGGAVLLFFLLRRLSVPGAWLAAAVFALHPVHVESVAWITERKNVLSGVFYLGAALAYARFALRDRREWGFYALAAVLFVCALLSKTVTSTLPAAALLAIWWKKGRVTLRDAAPLIPFFAAGIGLGLVTVWMERSHVGALGDEWSLSFVEHILLAGRIPWFYAAKLIWPANLMFIYPRFEIDAGAPRQYLFPLAGAAVVAALWLMRRRIGRGPLVAALFFAGTLAPALGFFNVYPMRFSFVADHFQYLASIGPIAALAAGAVLLASRTPENWRPRACSTLLAAVAVLGLLAYRQTGIYRDPITLWQDTAARNPAAWIAHNNLGELLVDAGQPQRAAVHCEEALRLKPDLAEALGNLANARYKMGLVAEAVASYHEFLRLDPDNARARCNLGIILSADGRLEEAAEHLAEAVRLAPRFARARYCLARTLGRLGRPEEAAAHMREAARLDPASADARFELGKLLAEAGDDAGAAGALREALARRPDWAEAANSLAWHLATRGSATPGDAAEAAALAERFSRSLGGRNPQLLDTLAAALARAGRFDEAVASAERALELAKAAELWELALAIQKRIELYRRKQPYVAP